MRAKSTALSQDRGPGPTIGGGYDAKRTYPQSTLWRMIRITLEGRTVRLGGSATEPVENEGDPELKRLLQPEQGGVLAQLAALVVRRTGQ